ncbi:BLOC-1-related complex subunit 5-like [Asterias rubens]|uniref:BLOC-1-related complex subunit 5-like n=1 Tax=Asterias rubens TaxID=7604 RepID=UPI001455B1FE|nr:BLOC-1-related complex subunit 5-like [Asterias rubens]XP_033627445.1 BLOC-1-related complex subunit 5-like [Asterias rubens]XP_033627446.1 BLOC-1-related complex subunit 5-like [Asterias rubens]
MGGTQSASSADASLPGQPHHSSDDIPYTSYSVDRNGIRDYAQISGKTNSPAKSSPNKAKNRTSTGSPAHNIVVVAEGTTPSEDARLASELQKMRDIPTFMPLIRGAPSLTSMEEANAMDKLDHRQLLLLCLRYQQHLKQCSEAVSFDQNVITNRIKEVDTEANVMTNLLFERQRRYAKLAEQIQKINEMSFTLQKVTKNVNQLIPLMDRLNNVLPDEERLEPFLMRKESKS